MSRRATLMLLLMPYCRYRRHAPLRCRDIDAMLIFAAAFIDTSAAVALSGVDASDAAALLLMLDASRAPAMARRRHTPLPYAHTPLYLCCFSMRYAAYDMMLI